MAGEEAYWLSICTGEDSGLVSSTYFRKLSTRQIQGQVFPTTLIAMRGLHYNSCGHMPCRLNMKDLLRFMLSEGSVSVVGKACWNGPACITVDQAVETGESSQAQ